MKITYFKIENSFKSFNSLVEIKFKSIKTVIKIKKIAKILADEMKFIEDTMKSINDEFMPKDKNGDPVLSEDGKSFIPTDPAARSKKIYDLYNYVTTIDFEPLEYEELDGAEISASDLFILDFIFSDYKSPLDEEKKDDIELIEPEEV